MSGKKNIDQYIKARKTISELYDITDQVAVGYMSNIAEAQLKIKKDREKEELEHKERAELERLKAKYES